MFIFYYLFLLYYSGSKKTKHFGYYENDKANGKGVLSYEDGSKYYGNWIDN